MGTNYYYKDDSELCEHCGKGSKKVHIGKSSSGWKFLFFAYDGIKTYGDVLNVIYDKVIMDEYDEVIDFREFTRLVESKQQHKNRYADLCIDDKGYEFYNYEFS